MEGQKIAAIIFLTLAFAAAAWRFDYFGVSRPVILVSVPAVLTAIFAARSLSSLSVAQRNVGGHGRTLVVGMQTSAMYMVVYLLTGMALDVVAPSPYRTLPVVLLEGLLLGTTLSFFYVLSGASRAVEKGMKELEKTLVSTPSYQHFIVQMMPYAAFAAAGGVGVFLAIGIYAAYNLYYMTGGILVTLALATLLFFLSRRYFLYCVKRFPKTHTSLLRSLHVSNVLLIAQLLPKIAQELVSPRPVNALAMTAGGLQLASLALALLSIFLIYGKFRQSVREVEVVRGYYKEEII